MKVELRNVVAVSKDLARMAERANDLRPVMRQIKREIMAPAARQSWASSGLNSRTGQLHGAITPFSGRTSSGVGLRYHGGRDLVWPKAVTHTFGRAKGSNRRRRNSKSKTGAYFRPSPWGNIPARPFIPDEQDILKSSALIAELFRRHLDVATP